MDFLLTVYGLISDLVPAGAGAFFGAYFAFLYSIRIQKNDEKERDYTNALRAQFVLFQQYQTLLNIRNNFSPHKNLENRHLTMPPFVGYFPDSPIDYGSIIFVFQGNDSNLLAEISLCDEQYHDVIRALDARSNEHHFFQSEVAESNQISEKTDIRLKSLTDGLFANVENTIEKNTQVHNKLNAYLKSKFPKKKLMVRALATD